MRIINILLAVLAIVTLRAQNITIKPYLQDASPNSIYILWETDSEAESIVELGPTNGLGNESTGINYSSGGNSIIHEVKIEGLDRFTGYQ
jgi:hypothetical protein